VVAAAQPPSRSPAPSADVTLRPSPFDSAAGAPPGPQTPAHHTSRRVLLHQIRGAAAALQLDRFDRADCALSGHLSGPLRGAVNTWGTFAFDASLTDTRLKIDTVASSG